MADQYINKSLDLTTTNEQTIYTVPTAQDYSTCSRPCNCFNKNILVCNDSGSAATITITVIDKSLGPATIKLFEAKSIAATTTTELITQPLVLEDGDQLKVQASTGNALHVVLSILQIT